MKGTAFPSLHQLQGLGKIALPLAILIWAMANLGFFSQGDLLKGLNNAITFSSGLFPPDPAVAPNLLEAMLETMQMALVGTLLGFALAVPWAIVAARNVSIPLMVPWFRALLGVVRAIPVLLWALIFVVIFGLGPIAGTMALAVYTLGYLGKLYYEAMEGVNPEVIEAVRGTGASRLQLARFVILPESANSLLSQLLFMLEYNVRSSAVLGFVGAGGIGFYIFSYINAFHYQKLMTAILLTLAVVMVLDFLSLKVRDRFLAPLAAAR